MQVPSISVADVSVQHFYKSRPRNLKLVLEYEEHTQLTSRRNGDLKVLPKITHKLSRRNIA